MRGIAIILLVGLALWMFASNLIPLTVLPAIGIWYVIRNDRGGEAVDQVFTGSIFVAIIAVTVLWLKRLFSSF